MATVLDPIEPVSLAEAKEFADFVAIDAENIRVLENSKGFLVLRYTKIFSQESLRVDPPRLIATTDGRLFVAKKMNKERFTVHRDEGDVFLHPTTELNGAMLMRAIGAPTYAVVRGKTCEYLEFLSGIDLCTANSNGILEETIGNSQRLEKLFFSLGITLAQAYIIGAGDRFGGIRINIQRLMSSSIHVVRSGEMMPTYNIDLSSALDDRVFDREIVNFLNVFCGRVPTTLQDHNKFLVLHKTILEGFAKGFKMSQSYFMKNRGKSSDLIRRFGNGKADRIFANLEMGTEQIRQAIQEHSSEDQYFT
ncbi:MAG: hypothetical protein ABIH69_05935 [bacterium]